MPKCPLTQHSHLLHHQHTLALTRRAMQCLKFVGCGVPWQMLGMSACAPFTLDPIDLSMAAHFRMPVYHSSTNSAYMDSALIVGVNQGYVQQRSQAREGCKRWCTALISPS
jgi:hypothetical protein